jgi:hypothetical protein
VDQAARVLRRAVPRRRRELAGERPCHARRRGPGPRAARARRRRRPPLDARGRGR